MIQQWSTSELGDANKAVYLADAINSTFCTTEFDPTDAATNYQGQLLNVDIGHMNVMHYTGIGLQKAVRRPSHIRKDKADHFIFYIPKSATVTMMQNNKSTVVTPGSFIFIETGQPFIGSLSSLGASHNAYELDSLRIPVALLREHLPNVTEYCNTVFPIRRGAGSMLVNFLHSVLEEGQLLTDATIDRVGVALTELIISSVSEQLTDRAGNALESNTRHQRIQRRVKDYIRANLTNPQLNTTSIAEHCDISLRQLHSVFEDSEWTVAAYIRELRLRNVQKSLKDPTMAHRSINELAYAWGFNDYAHFSRTYKKRFGTSPAADRGQR